MLAFSGFLLDWLITRDWRKVAIALFILAPAALLIVCSLWGAATPKDALAGKYLALGERELNDTNQDWAYQRSQDVGADEELDTVSRYTEALFRRARALQPNNPRTTFVIGVFLAHRGQTAQAISIMELLAPDNRQGHLPAHAWLANFMLRTQPVPAEQVPRLRHHVDLAVKMERPPEQVLNAATQFALNDLDNSRAIDLLSQSARQDPQYEAELFRLAFRLGNQRVAEQAADKALPRLLKLVEEGRATADDRISLADVLYYRDDIDAAQGVLEEALQQKNLSEADRKKLTRGLSEHFRRRYAATLQITPNSWAADLKLLDRAMRADPTNPLIAEEVAKLARIGGESPPQPLLDKLQDYLAQGIATPITHTWLAEAYILRENYGQAITHLESVVRRLPGAAHSHNNLAYAIALNTPDRLNDALLHAQTAVDTDPSQADFHDTLGFILLKLNRVDDAIPAFETAIELAPNRPDFHQRLADAYDQKGEQSLADAHRRLATDLSQPPSQPAGATESK